MTAVRAARSPAACDDASQRLAELADGALAPPERRALEAHIDACPACRAQLAALREALAAAASAPAGAVDDATQDALLQTFRAWHARRSTP